MEERNEIISAIKCVMDIIGEIVIENVEVDYLLSMMAEEKNGIVSKYKTRISYNEIRKIGRVFLDKQNSDLFINSICENGIVVSNDIAEDDFDNAPQIAVLNYEFLSDEILDKIMDIMNKVIKL